MNFYYHPILGLQWSIDKKIEDTTAKLKPTGSKFFKRSDKHRDLKSIYR